MLGINVINVIIHRSAFCFLKPYLNRLPGSGGIVLQNSQLVSLFFGQIFEQWIMHHFNVYAIAQGSFRQHCTKIIRFQTFISNAELILISMFLTILTWLMHVQWHLCQIVFHLFTLGLDILRWPGPKFILISIFLTILIWLIYVQRHLRQLTLSNCLPPFYSWTV